MSKPSRPGARRSTGLAPPPGLDSPGLPDLAHHHPGLRYRGDIDGLRAVAVAAVVLFHAGMPGVGGGFVGVDVFFVISGFLITALITHDVEHGRYSIANFYQRRIRRIFPALFGLLAACTPVFGWLLFPNDLETFAAASIATALFTSNVFFWHYSGYFDPQAELNPLTHTWSLAVEEQFYIAYPLLLAWLLRHDRRRMPIVLAVVTLTSFAIAAATVPNHPDAAFYLPAGRFWELLLGALAALGIAPRLHASGMRNAVAAVGLIAVIASAGLYTDDTAFPGLAALLPCLGTAFLIHAGSCGPTLVGRALATRPLVFLGLISYSLYLWHWPVLVLFRQYFAKVHLSPTAAAASVLVSLVLATLSWRFVERPFRDPGRVSRRTVFVGGAVASVATIAIGVALLVADGLPGRFDARTLAILHDVDTMWSDPCIDSNADDVIHSGLCTFGVHDGRESGYLLWGDSHAAALRDTLDANATAAGKSGLFAIRAGCPPLLGVDRVRPGFRGPCVEFNNAVVEWLDSPDSPSTVVLAARWALWSTGRGYKEETIKPGFLVDDESETGSYDADAVVMRRGLRRTIRALLAAGKRVVVVGPTPEVGWHVPRVLAMQRRTGIGQRRAPTREEFLARTGMATVILTEETGAAGVEMVWLHDALCDAESCPVERDGVPLYQDDDHLSVHGGRLVAPLLAAVFR